MGNFVLDGKHIPHFAVELLRPQTIAVRHVAQLRGNAQTVALALDAAFQHRGHVKQFADLPDVFVPAFESKGRGARRHAQFRHSGQCIEDVLGNAIAQILVLLVSTHIDKRQHGERLLVSHARGNVRAWGHRDRRAWAVQQPPPAAEED